MRFNGVEYVHEQCVAVDNGKRCELGVRIKKNKLCNKHQSRLIRHGTTERLTKSDMERLKLEELGMLERGISTTCLCSHTFLEHHHKVKSARRCKIWGCNCKHFAGVDSILLNKVKTRMKRLGVVPLNDAIICTHCRDTIKVGYWHDGHVFIRILEHLKTHQVRKSDLPAYRETG